MSHKEKVFSLNKKILFFGTFLSCFFLLFFLIFWASSRYITGQQNRLLEVQHQFSIVVNGLSEADSKLYTYAQGRKEELKKQCESILKEVKAGADQLSEYLNQPIFTDLSYMVEAYIQSTDNLLTETEASTGQFLSWYQESAEHIRIINSLMDSYTSAVDQDRVECQKKLKEIQKVTERVTVIAGILLMTACIAFLMSFSKRITKNLTLLTKRAEKICEGSWDIEMPQAELEMIKKDRDEVAVLTKAFYRMLQMIHTQIEQLKQQKEMERQLKEAEIEAVNMKARLEHAQLLTLQSRVNPHFLFNALNVIGGQAAEEGADKTLDMIFQTADYLRYSLSKLDKIVTLEEELENVEDYLMIQKRRFAERLEFLIECEETCKKAQIPSMILQPLCENALIHGVMPVPKGGKIKIKAWRKDEIIYIKVIDDGIGFSKERLEEIRLRLKQDQYDDTQGIGMNNTIQRLKMYFQENVGCEIESEQGKGTVIILSFPVQMQCLNKEEPNRRKLW